MPYAPRIVLVTVLALAALGTQSSPAKAQTETARYAVVVGANRGTAGDARLKYAVSDARRLSRVLIRYGQFAEDRVVVLENPTASRIEGALKRLSRRIGYEARNKNAFVTVFYSGHADALALHASGTTLPWKKLEKLVKGLPADLKLLILDACRSGSATRVKGTKVVQPFLTRKEKKAPEGLAILSSATAGEDAQESDELKASFFTHHFVSALRGVADRDRDGAVTLEEAYQYTADRTVASTASTLAGIQHPTYKYDLKGKSDFVLTRTAKRRAVVQLKVQGQYVFHRGSEGGPIVAEANIDKQEARDLWLAPGNYFVRVRRPTKLYEGKVKVAARNNTIALKDLRPVSYAQLARKGPTPRGAFSLSGWGGYSMPMLDYEGLPTAGLIFSWDSRVITFDAQLRFAYGWSNSDTIDANLFETGLLVGVRKVFDVNRFAFSLGIRGGAGYVVQTFDSARVAPSRQRLIPLIATVVRAEYQLAHGMFIGLEADLSITYLKSTDGLGNSETEVPVRFAGSLGFGRYW